LQNYPGSFNWAVKKEKTRKRKDKKVAAKRGS
jgi:hypothetical protein